jgi:hypothetical protein
MQARCREWPDLRGEYLQAIRVVDKGPHGSCASLSLERGAEAAMDAVGIAAAQLGKQLSARGGVESEDAGYLVLKNAPSEDLREVGGSAVWDDGVDLARSQQDGQLAGQWCG